ncbi:Spy/CpxP family protein refolding chaperone [Caballeronia sp. dw_276]|jgi:periplasmic protein CpxP/Spy|uniref:Spy/CpxP family protein refolding chaperone n=1 Tax=Caballeronia sp. dw_276 TaxID=2719795 RepID=UPI001BD5E67B|nr:Spy/CpxP family protein refolding chaperone [Caballeronia sp. dw_276]
MKKTLVALAASLALSTAFAQSSAPVAASTPGASAPESARGQAREARVEQRIADLHSKLKITSAQEDQWNKFADVMRDNGHTIGELYRQRVALGTNTTAVDDMKQYAQITQAQADGTKHLVDAFEPLYASLSPEQKKLADASFHQTARRGEHKGRKAPRGKATPDSIAPDAASATKP